MSKVMIASLVLLTACAAEVPPPSEPAPAREVSEPEAEPAPEPEADITVPEVIEPEPEPTEAQLAWERRMHLLWDLPQVPEDKVAIAVELTNDELEANGYERDVEMVRVHLGTAAEMQELAGEPALGWSPGAAVYLLEGAELCEVPEGYEHRLFGWVMSHELLHTVGFEHGPEMKMLTDKLGQRWRAYCG